MDYLDFMLENGYIADDEVSTESEDESDSGSDEEEESELFITKNKSRKQLHEILDHLIRHPPVKFSKKRFECSMCFDRMSRKWNKGLERKYQLVLKKLKK